MGRYVGLTQKVPPASLIQSTWSQPLTYKYSGLVSGSLSQVIPHLQHTLPMVLSPTHLIPPFLSYPQSLHSEVHVFSYQVFPTPSSGGLELCSLTMDSTPPPTHDACILTVAQAQSMSTPYQHAKLGLFSPPLPILPRSKHVWKSLPGLSPYVLTCPHQCRPPVLLKTCTCRPHELTHAGRSQALAAAVILSQLGYPLAQQCLWSPNFVFRTKAKKLAFLSLKRERANRLWIRQ